MVANPHSPEWSGERPCKTAPTSSSMTSARGISGAGSASSQRFSIGVDRHALRHRAQIGVLAGDDDGAEMLMQRPLHAGAGRGSCAHAIGPPVLQRLLLIGGCGFPQLLARRAVLLRVASAPAFSDPAAELVGIEAAVAAVGQGGKGAVLEREERRIRALRRARRVPRSGQRAHGRGAAAREQPHDVDLMRSLAEYDAAALLRVELLAAARPVEKVRVVAGVDHAHGAKPAARAPVPPRAGKGRRSCGCARRGAGCSPERPPRPSPGSPRWSAPSASRPAHACRRPRRAPRALHGTGAASRCRPHRYRRPRTAPRPMQRCARKTPRQIAGALPGADRPRRPAPRADPAGRSAASA